jgi:hypothetical protein
MSKFTEPQAVKLVSEANGIRVEGKRIIKDRTQFRGYKGLTTLSALDYLTNFCGYRA